MIPLSLTEVADATGARPLAPLQEVTALAVTTDSRQVTEGSLFVAIRGERVDGHIFLAQVLREGAAGALVDEEFIGSPEHQQLLAEVPDADARLLAVPQILPAVGALARHSLAALRERGEVKVVAITGSVGKTSTKDLLATILRGDLDAADERVISPPGSFNNELGLPLTVLRATGRTEVLVAEMGADHIGNIADLTTIAPPDVAVVLAVGHAHLGEFGGIEAVATAKSEMVAGALPTATVVLNGDDPRVDAMASRAADTTEGTPLPIERTVWRYGRGHGEVSAQDITLDELGRPSFTLALLGESAGTVSLGLVGEHHVANALAAAAAAHALGVAPEVILARLSGAVANSPHRMAVTSRADGVLVVDDAYNANPDSMRAALAALDTLGRGRSRRIAVLGDMLELGEDGPEEHRGVGREVARHGIDVLVAVGELSRGFLDGAAESGPRPRDRWVPDLDGARQELAEIVQDQDVVLFKGSNGSGLWKLADEYVQEGGAA